jgi:Protein of unknown function (DUF2478)
MAALADGVELLIINRFGRAESLGRGLVGCFAAAIEAGVAVLTAVRPPYDRAWYAYHGGSAPDLAPEMQEIIDWALTSTARSPALLSQGKTASIQDATRKLSADCIL